MIEISALAKSGVASYAALGAHVIRDRVGRAGCVVAIQWPYLQHRWARVPNVGMRRCSKPSCTAVATWTLTYVYSDSTAVLGPLATYREPHCYDLCDEHSVRPTAPRGWEVVRLEIDAQALLPQPDDLEALANAVREIGQVTPSASVEEVSRRGHLRVLRDIPESN